MITITYPEPAFRIKDENGSPFIFDSLRKKWLSLTEEEWVRQNFIQYLIKKCNYPSAMIALEKKIHLGELDKRFDILVYDKDHQPWMMVECKAPTITLDNAVLEQVLRYNISVPVQYLIITNGSYCFGYNRNDGKLTMVSEIPAYI